MTTTPTVDGRFFSVRYDPARRLVVVVRSAEPFADLEELRAVFTALIDAVDRLCTDGVGLLVDLRAVRGRNDADFEEAMRPLRRRLFAGRARSGLLVRSAVGLLQIQRHLREDGIAALVDADEAALVAALSAG